MIANTLGHIQHAESPASGIGILNTLKSLVNALRTTPRPTVLVNRAAVTPETVETRLHSPAWRNLGRFL